MLEKENEMYYKLKAFFANLPLFLRLCWRWRSWDYTYSIEVFAKLLKEQVKAVEAGPHKISKKEIRKYKTCVAFLEELAEDKKLPNPVPDKLLSKHPPEWCIALYEESWVDEVFQRGLSDEARLIREGIWNANHKRMKKANAEEYQRRWAYISKYIRKIWV